MVGPDQFIAGSHATLKSPIHRKTPNVLTAHPVKPVIYSLQRSTYTAPCLASLIQKRGGAQPAMMVADVLIFPEHLAMVSWRKVIAPGPDHQGLTQHIRVTAASLSFLHQMH